MPDRSKTILILGGGTMQLPAIRTARQAGWRVVVADGNPEPDGKDLADVFLNVDLKDTAGLEREAARLARVGGLDGVFTAGTDFSASVAWVAGRLGLPGIPHETALGATDKSRMRELFARHGVPHPRFARVRAEDDVLESCRHLGFPLVVKPVDNMGARGVRRVDDAADLVQSCAAALSLSRTSTASVEEYMEGPELSLDAVVHRGVVTICGIADRHIYFPPHFVELGHTMPTRLDAAVVARVEEVFREGIRALGIHTGAAKGDIKLTPEGPKIGEIAARLSGGYMSGWTYPYSSGVNVTEAALRVAVGLDPGDLTPRDRMPSAERAFISIPGVVAGVEGLARARETPWVRNVFVRTPKGLREVLSGSVPDPSGIEAVFPTNNVEKCGNVITQAPTRAEAVDGAREALRRIFVRLRPDERRTTTFLLGPPRAHVAHPVSGRLRDAMAAMPAWTGEGEPLGYLPLDLGADARVEDWHGLRLDQALEWVRTVTGVGPAGSGPGLRLGKAVWRAMSAGGSQGGVYVVDTVRALADARRDIRSFLGDG